MASWFWGLWLLILCHYIAPATQGARAPPARTQTAHSGSDIASPIRGWGERAIFGRAGHCVPPARRASLSKCAAGPCKGYSARSCRGDAGLRKAPAVALRDVPTTEQRKSRILRWMRFPLAESYILVELGQSSRTMAATTGSVAVTGITEATEITQEASWQRATGAGSACGKGCAASPATSSTESTGIAGAAFHAYFHVSTGAGRCPRSGHEPREGGVAEADTGSGAASGSVARGRARNFGCSGPDGGAGPYEEPSSHRLGSGHSSQGTPADSARPGGLSGHLEHIYNRPHHACCEASRRTGQGPGRHGRARGDVGWQAAGGDGEPCQAGQQGHHTRAEDSHGCRCFGCSRACRGQGGRGYCHGAGAERPKTAAATVGVSACGCTEASAGEGRQGPRGAEQPAGTRGIPYTSPRRTGWGGWTSYCRNIVFFAGQLCGNAAGAYQATTCSSPWQGLRIDGHQSDRSLGRFSVRETFPTDTRCSYSTVWMDPSFVLPARAQMQALLLQHEVRYDVQFSTSLVWDPRLESTREEAICVMPRALAESTVSPVFQSSRFPEASDETGRPVRVGQDRA